MTKPIVFRPSSQRGFALIVALSLMGFILLLLLSITTLVHVSTSISRQDKQMQQAQANALLGLNIAVGELQKYAGRDRSITATADIASRNNTGDRLALGQDPANNNTLDDNPKGLSRLAHGTRFWTGVWEDRNDKDSIYTTTPSPQILNWLVSGNEDGNITFTPNTGTVLSSSDHRISLDNNREAVILLGDESVGTESNTTNYFQNFGLASPHDDDIEISQDRYVIAPLVDIEGGSYAFWVGDEGIKARYNLADNYATHSTAAETALRARSAPRIAVELVTASDLPQPATDNELVDFSDTPDYLYDDYPFVGNRDALVISALTRVDSLKTATLLQFSNPATADERLLKRFHSLTTVSQGLLTNSQSGGLKQDLSLALEDAATYTAMFPDDRILPEVVSPAAGPNWATLKTYYELADRIQTAINLDNPLAPGISPTITELRLLFKLFPNRVNGHWEIRTSVAVGIANPYTVPMTSSGLQLAFDRLGKNPISGDYDNIGLSNTPTQFGPWWIWALRDTDNENVKSRIDSFKLIDAPSQNVTSQRGFLTVPETRFSIPETTWAPGEMKLFAITDRDQVLDLTATVASPIALNPISYSPLETHYFTYDTGKSLPASDVSPDPLNNIDGTPYDAWLQFHHGHDGWGGRDSPVGFSLELYSNGDEPFLRIDPLSFYTASPTKPVVNNNVDLEGGIIAGALHLYLALPHAVQDNRFVDKRTPYSFRPFIDNNLRAAWQPPAPFLSSPYGIISMLPYAGERTITSQGYTDSLGSAFSDHWFWGGSFTDTNTAKHSFTLYDLPQRVNASDPPILSIAQLQHVDLTADDRTTSVGYQSGLAVGNSFYSPLISRDRTVQTRTANSYLDKREIRFFDISYLLNAKLFDGYFFSSFAGGSLGDQLPNQRYNFIEPSNFFSTTADEDPGTGPAKSLLVDGAFNINSTSPEAWAAVLASTIRVPVNGDDPGKGTAFSRSLHQPGTAEQSGHGNGQDSYNGYRRLTDGEVRELAWQVVKQVRQRGPFTSLAHFVNRAIVPASAGSAPTAPPASWGLSGTLQSAIDATSINQLPGLTSDWVATNLAASQDGLAQTGVWPDAATDYPALLAAEAVEERPLQGNRSVGIPGILTQADVLQVLAPILSARSDTFRIRAYGEVLGLDQTTTAQAWCEAIVQRMPDYIDPIDAPGIAPANLTSNQNQLFGRRFEIVSFRWLNENEI